MLPICDQSSQRADTYGFVLLRNLCWRGPHGTQLVGRHFSPAMLGLPNNLIPQQLGQVMAQRRKIRDLKAHLAKYDHQNQDHAVGALTTI